MLDPVPWVEHWPTAYPCRTGLWTVTDNARWGVVDPATGTPQEVNPADDPKLDTLAQALTQGQLLSYRHHRRAVLRTSHGFAKIVAPKKTEEIAQRHILATKLGLNGPRVTGYGHGRIDLERVRGQSLHDRLLNRRVTFHQIVATAHAVAELHQHSPSAVPAHQGSPTWVETTRRAAPALADELQRTLDQLPPQPDERHRLIHSDLHDKNILIERDTASLIDLDGLALGDPATDLGNLTAHFTFRALQGHCTNHEAQQFSQVFLAAYARKQPVDHEAIQIARRHTWLRLAALYHFRRTNQHLVPTLLRLAATPQLTTERPTVSKTRNLNR